MVGEATASGWARERPAATGREAAGRTPALAVPYRGPMRDDQIALQLYTVRRLAAVDLVGTLRSVAEAGYRAVELAGLPEVAPAELKKMLDDVGLRPVASHEGIERLRADAGAVAGRLGELGCPRVIVPWMPEADRATADDVSRFAAELGEHARRMARGRDRPRLSQPRFRVRAARRDDDLGRPPGRTPTRGRTRTGPVLGRGRRP